MTNETTRDVLDVRTLPSTVEQVVRENGGMFPVMAQAADGSLLAIMRSGAGHLGLGGKLDMVRSKDGGQSWAPPMVIVDGPADERNPAFGVSNAGTVVLSWLVQLGYEADGKYAPKPGDTSVAFSRSHDHGLTWDAPIELESHGLEGSPYGRIVSLSDGTMLMVIYTTEARNGHKGGAHLVRSTDDGLTWGAPELIAEGHNETSLLVLPDGEMLAALRLTERAVQRLDVARSSDGGATWSTPEPVTGPFEHPADLVLLDDSTVLLTYGNRRRPYRIEGLLSNDLGKTWQSRLLALSGPLYGCQLDEERSTDLGYPTNVVLEDGSVVTMYYLDPFALNARREWTGPETTPFYLETGYQSRVVRWNVAEMLEAFGR